MKPLIIVSVSGGCVQAVYCDVPAKIVVADFDNYRHDDALCREVDPDPIESADDLILEDQVVVRVTQK